MQVSLGTGPGVYAVLAHICRSPLEAVRQFVENAADAIEMAGEADGRIRVHGPAIGEDGLVLSIEDNGAGLSPDKMRQVLGNIGHSEKLRLALRGEKGVGILAFALICEEVHVSSSVAGGADACMVLRRNGLEQGAGEILQPCPRHHRTGRGTSVYLTGVLPEAAAAFAPKRLREYLAREFATDLRDKCYSLVLENEGRSEVLEPARMRGIGIISESLPLEVWGSAAVDIRMVPGDAPTDGITLYGRGGVRVSALRAIEDLTGSAWLDQHLEGSVRCDRLHLTADKTAIVQDPIYLQFLATLRAAEPRLRQLMADAASEHMERRLAQITRGVDTLVERFIRHMEDGAPLQRPARRPEPEWRAVAAAAPAETLAPVTRVSTAPKRALPVHFRMGQADQVRQEWQSWGDATTEVVEINSQHPDFLEAESDVERCSRYLFSLWAKEHLLAEYGSDSRRVAEVLLSWLNKIDPLLPSR